MEGRVTTTWKETTRLKRLKKYFTEFITKKREAEGEEGETKLGKLYKVTKSDAKRSSGINVLQFCSLACV